MATITVNKIATSNNVPKITGTVNFDRFDSSGNPKETIQIIVNYNTYTLFDGNLGLNEKVTPNIWQLQFDSALFPSTYDVEANVIDVNTGTIIASDDTTNELIITPPPTSTFSSTSGEPTLLEKFAIVSNLMQNMNKLFGGQNGISGTPSVHPAYDDQSSTSLAASGKEERDQHPIPKSKDRTKDQSNIAQKANLKVVDSAAIVAEVPDIPPPSSADILSQMGEYDAAAQAATEAVRSAPDTAAEAAQFQYSSTPTSSTG